MNDEKKQLEQERNELNTLINKGVSFELKDTEFEVEKRFFGLIRRYKPKEVTRTFRIEEDRLIAKPGKGGIRWIEDTKKLDELTSLFARKIKPSILYKLYVLVNTMGNLGDFMNSIRLISTERTTMPIRIEENNEG